jgi:hypothetical protein
MGVIEKFFQAVSQKIALYVGLEEWFVFGEPYTFEMELKWASHRNILNILR